MSVSKHTVSFQNKLIEVDQGHIPVRVHKTIICLPQQLRCFPLMVNFEVASPGSFQLQAGESLTFFMHITFHLDRRTCLRHYSPLCQSN